MPKKKYWSETVTAKGRFNPLSLENFKTGDHIVTVGRLKGSRSKKKIQRILHPISERNGCKLKKAIKDSREWRWGRDPDKIFLTKKPKIGRHMVALGTVPYIDYITTKGKRGKKTLFQHDFKKPYPVALSNKNENFILLQGNFKVKPAGVTG